MRVGNNNQFPALVSVHVPEQIPLQLLLLQLLEVAGIQKKIIRMIRTGTGSPFVIVVLIFVLKLVYFEIQDVCITLGFHDKVVHSLFLIYMYVIFLVTKL